MVAFFFLYLKFYIILNLGINLSSNTFENIHDESNAAQLDFKSFEEKDAFLIFRALCKLSMKELPENPDPKHAFIIF